MARAKFDNTPIGNGDGTITGYDAESGTTATYNPNDPGAGRTNVTDANTKRDRYRSLGEAAGAAPAYQVDFGLAQGDRANGIDARNQQLQAASLQGAAATGAAPSAAAIMGNQAAGQSLGAALGATAGARPGGMAAAQMAAQQGQVGMQQQATAGYGAQRAGELHDARSAFGADMTGIRAGDYGSMAMSQQQADAQAQSENAQRSMNQAGQMGFEQMGVNSEQQQVNSRLRQMQIQANANQSTAQGDAARAAMERSAAQGIVMAAGAAAASDERAKQNARPMMLSDIAAKREAYVVGVRDGSQQVGDPRFIQTFSRDNADGTAKGTKSTHEPQLREPVTFSRDNAQGQPSNVATTHGEGPPPVPGMVVKGNADLKDREPVWNPDGTVSTVRSMSFNEGGKEILVPTAADGKIYSSDDAIDRYHATGEHLGIFDNEKNATAYAQALHEQEAKRNLVRPKGPGLAAAAHKAHDPMTNALADGLAPYQYEYKPGFDAAEGQASGEKNVGPMAQNMASNPVTGAAVSTRPDGLLQIDMKKGMKLSLAAAGHNARMLQEQQAQIDALKKGSGATRRSAGDGKGSGAADVESLGPSGEDNRDEPDYNYIKSPSPLNVSYALEQKNGSISPQTEAYMRRQGMWGPKTDAILQARGLKGGR